MRKSVLILIFSAIWLSGCVAYDDDWNDRHHYYYDNRYDHYYYGDHYDNRPPYDNGWYGHPDNRPPYNRPPEHRPPGNRPPEHRPPEHRPPENRPPTNRPHRPNYKQPKPLPH